MGPQRQPNGPAVVVVFNGKRKSGKDYTTELLKQRLGSAAQILRLSGPLKSQYAKNHALDADRLLDASGYKERYRKDMITWGEAQRKADPFIFCRLVCEEAQRSPTPVWIVSDARRKSDLTYFRTHYRMLTVRVEAIETARVARGYMFTAGVDDAESECDLDGTEWDYVLRNDGDNEALQKSLDGLLATVQAMDGL